MQRRSSKWMVILAVVSMIMFSSQPAYAVDGLVTAPVEQTGQTTSFAAGDDGDIQAGVQFPSPRFTDNSNGTVTDNLTGLIWLKNGNCFDRAPGGSGTWAQALTDANTLASGSCGLTDGSVAGAWRLPNVKELQSLIHFGIFNPALPPGHPFSGVQSSAYWSSTTFAISQGEAWRVGGGTGSLFPLDKRDISGFVWPVRGGDVGAIIQVTIDIKPGSDPNSINLGSGGTVPVAIFSTTDFDATMVDPTTITLASAPVKLKGKGTPMASFEDVNRDGLLDLVVHVSTEALQLSETDVQAVLEGQTFDGTAITGVDSVRVVP